MSSFEKLVEAESRSSNVPEYTSAILPLQGKRILVTRTREQASVFSERLRQLGAIPIEFPTIRIVPPQDWAQLDNVLKRLFMADDTGQPYYSWLILTSANGVQICCERLRQLGYRPQDLRVRVAVIGPATAVALARYGITAELVPEEYVAESVAIALLEDAQRRGIPLRGQRILLARAAEARKVLVTTLQQEGALVEEVPAYHTHAVERDDKQGREVLCQLQQHQLDILTFTSSSTVRNFVAWLKQCAQHDAGAYQDLVDLCSQATIACIGPITSQTARELGLPVHIEAEEFTINGLVKAIVHFVHREDTSWQNR
jgi:uroporphyrinogen-III synthase